MAIQNAVTDTPPVAIEGMTSDVFFVEEESKYSQVDLTNGRFVCFGTADNQVKLPTVTGDVTGKPCGITRYQPATMVNWPAGQSVPYPQGTVTPVVRRGKVWVKVEEAVVPGDPVFARFAAGAGGTILGAFRKTADTATAVAIPSAVYRTTAGINGLALVELAP